MKNIQLTTFEVISTLAIVGLVPIVLSYPQNIAKTFESASVLNYVYTIFIVLLFYIIFYKLYKPFSGKNILGISNFLGGKTLENIFGFSVATYLLILSIPTLHEFGQDLKNMMFTNSLVSEINLFLILGVLLGLFTGMRGLFRISGLVFSFVLIGLFLMFIALYGKIDLTNLTPIFGTGYNEVFVNGFFRIGIFNSLFILLFVAPSVKNIKKAGFYSIILSSSVIFLILFLLFTIFPHEALSQNSFPFFELIRMIGFGRFFQRLESIFSLIWIILACIFLGLALRFTIELFMQVFNLKYINRLIPCTCLLTLNFSILVPDHSTSVMIRAVLYSFTSILLFFIAPLIILLLANLKISGGKNEAISNKNIS